jgi:hypothetical protein
MEYKSKMVQHTVDVEYISALLELIENLCFIKFDASKNKPQDMEKLKSEANEKRKWETIVAEKIKLPVWETEEDFLSYPTNRKGLHTMHRAFLISVGFDF